MQDVQKFASVTHVTQLESQSIFPDNLEKLFLEISTCTASVDRKILT